VCVYIYVYVICASRKNIQRTRKIVCLSVLSFLNCSQSFFSFRHVAIISEISLLHLFFSSVPYFLFFFCVCIPIGLNATANRAQSKSIWLRRMRRANDTLWNGAVASFYLSYSYLDGNSSIVTSLCRNIPWLTYVAERHYDWFSLTYE